MIDNESFFGRGPDEPATLGWKVVDRDGTVIPIPESHIQRIFDAHKAIRNGYLIAKMDSLVTPERMDSLTSVVSTDNLRGVPTIREAKDVLQVAIIMDKEKRLLTGKKNGHKFIMPTSRSSQPLPDDFRSEISQALGQLVTRPAYYLTDFVAEWNKNVQRSGLPGTYMVMERKKQ